MKEKLESDHVEKGSLYKIILSLFKNKPSIFFYILFVYNSLSYVRLYA